MVAAALLFHSKLIYPDGAIKEMMIWELPKATFERPHRLKYRLYYGDANGKCRVRYDNEHGKGDHRHLGEKEVPYHFVNIETLVSDFQQDIDKIRGAL